MKRTKIIAGLLVVLGLGMILVAAQQSQDIRSKAAGTPVAVTLFLHGIGKGGDSANPTGSGNMSPARTQRAIQIEVYNQQNQLVGNQQGNVTYNSTNGNFTGTIDLGTTLPTGPYTVKVKSDQYLRTLVPGIQTITSGQTATLPPTYLITGDVNNDNIVNIQDYNMLIGCYSDLNPAPNCPTGNKEKADITDDGNVNSFDYNLFLRELTNISGQSGGGTLPSVTPTFGQTGPTPTRTPTPTSLPTPTTGQTSGCPAFPAIPNANCTGWQHTGVTLKSVSTVGSGVYFEPDGNMVVTQDGKVIDGIDFDGCIFVKADNVTIKRSRLTRGWCAEGTISGQFEHTNLVIQDVEIDGRNQSIGYSGISGENFTCERCKIHGMGSSIRATSNVIIKDSYMYGNSYGGESHNSGMSIHEGGNVQVIHNHIECNAGANCTAAFELNSKDSMDWTGKVLNNITIQNNFFQTDSGYCVYGGWDTFNGQPAHATNIKFLSNGFGNCGDLGPVANWAETTAEANAAGNVWSGNYSYPNQSNIITP